VDLLIINTDGWVLGQEALDYKIRLINKITPNIIVAIRKEDELEQILTALKEQQHNLEILMVDSPKAIVKGKQEKRKILRELSYRKYLKEAKVQSFTLSSIRTRDLSLESGNTRIKEQIIEIVDFLETRPVYMVENSSSIFIVLKKNAPAIAEEQIENLRKSRRKSLQIVKEGDEDGLLVGLYDKTGGFLGIGILSGVDYKRRIIKVYTPINSNVASITFGQIKVDRTGKELGLSTVYANYVS
jgi:polynucleotide 5'-hydroxyl-kinase GRC3/NOL9